VKVGNDKKEGGLESPAHKKLSKVVKTRSQAKTLKEDTQGTHWRWMDQGSPHIHILRKKQVKGEERCGHMLGCHLVVVFLVSTGKERKPTAEIRLPKQNTCGAIPWFDRGWEFRKKNQFTKIFGAAKPLTTGRSRYGNLAIALFEN